MAFAHGDSLNILLTSSSVHTEESLVFQKSAAKSNAEHAKPVMPICTSLVECILSSPDAMRNACVTINSFQCLHTLSTFVTRGVPAPRGKVRCPTFFG